MVEISRVELVLALFPRLGMLTAVEFDNQAPRDAAEVGKSRDITGVAGGI